MKNFAGRFYAKKDTNGRLMLIGVGLDSVLNEGHVYEVTQDIFGEMHIKDKGKSLLADDKQLNNISMDAFLALNQGKHCLVEGEDVTTKCSERK